MDCSTADLPNDVVHDSPGNGSSCSDDDVPLSGLLTKPHSKEKQSRENTRSSKTNSEKDKSAMAAKKPEKKDNTSLRSNGTDNKKAGGTDDDDDDDSSDNEPLKKIAKKPSKALKSTL
ncbi:uncharacterized protein LOC144529269 [Sander vitreus]